MTIIDLILITIMNVLIYFLIIVAKEKNKEKKENTYYAIYLNYELFDHLPLKECRKFYDSLDFKRCISCDYDKKTKKFYIYRDMPRE